MVQVLWQLSPATASGYALRQEILKVPGIGKGVPTDSDWQKVGELCLGATKENVTEGEFEGVEPTFLGLNNQNLHNFLFRAFQQAIATGTVDFDMIEMDAPFEGDTAGRGLLDEMPDWVKTQIDMDDYVDYLRPPVGSWNGKIYRVTIDGDCHTFAYRKDYFGKDAIGGVEVPKMWPQVMIESS